MKTKLEKKLELENMPSFSNEEKKVFIIMSLIMILWAIQIKQIIKKEEKVKKI